MQMRKCLNQSAVLPEGTGTAAHLRSSDIFSSDFQLIEHA